MTGSLVLSDNLDHDLHNVSTGDLACTAFVVRNRSTSSGDVLIHVDGLHEGSNYFPIPPGEKEYFRLGVSVQHVKAKAASGTPVNIDFGPSVRL